MERQEITTKIYGIAKPIAPRIKKAFDIPDRIPRIIFTDKIPDTMAFAYNAKGNCRIAVNLSFLKTPRNHEDALFVQVDGLPWALSEEIAHFCHYRTNLPLFQERIAESDKEDKLNNQRALELANLVELVARYGGFYGGTAPGDFNQTVEGWRSIFRECGEGLNTETFKEIFDAKMKSPEYAERVSSVSDRVWGTHLADYIVSNSGLGCLPDYGLLRSLARASTFQEASRYIENTFPNSLVSKEAKRIAEEFFPISPQ